MGQELRDSNGNYHIGGQMFPSMTKILKEMCPKMALDNWKERTPNWRAVGSQAAVRGTLMHMRFAVHGVRHSTRLAETIRLGH